jgi:hypothetical protein
MIKRRSSALTIFYHHCVIRRDQFFLVAEAYFEENYEILHFNCCKVYIPYPLLCDLWRETWTYYFIENLLCYHWSYRTGWRPVRIRLPEFYCSKPFSISHLNSVSYTLCSASSFISKISNTSSSFVPWLDSLTFVLKCRIPSSCYSTRLGWISLFEPV